MFENPRRGRQARNFTTNAPKILDLKSSSEQIFSRKLPLGAPDSKDPEFWKHWPFTLRFLNTASTVQASVSAHEYKYPAWLYACPHTAWYPGYPPMLRTLSRDSPSRSAHLPVQIYPYQVFHFCSYFLSTREWDTARLLSYRSPLWVKVCSKRI